MQVVWGRRNVGAQLVQSAPAVAIGNFDGVHLGHQALVAAARRWAETRGGLTGVLTFDPHPNQFFAQQQKGPGASFPLLMPLARRLELLGEAGADFACVEPFDSALASMEPETFVREVLVDGLRVGRVVVGYDFAFGRKRAGNPVLLAAFGAKYGFGVTVLPPIESGGIVVSSSRVRERLAEGDIAGATALLGRPPEITGEVVRGVGRGRGFGIPTANLRMDVPLTLATGIYAATGELLGRSGRHAAAVSVGTNPTFTQTSTSAPITIEAYLLDYPDEDLYGAELRLRFLAHLRDERRFDSVAALRAAIDDDVARTRAIVKTEEGTARGAP